MSGVCHHARFFITILKSGHNTINSAGFVGRSIEGSSGQVLWVMSYKHVIKRAGFGLASNPDCKSQCHQKKKKKKILKRAGPVLGLILLLPT
jgi:hypothetical protein